MALILNIDTATENAIVSISEKGKILNCMINNDQKDHASFLQPAIKKLLHKTDLPIDKLNAVAVTAGPGSYTGLRVSMASAKGLCYALNIPMITLNTLKVMALASINQIRDKKALYCPMIDARRMEVFTAVYDYYLTQIIQPGSIIIIEQSFYELLKINKIYFSGSGILKLKTILNNPQAVFNYATTTPDAMAELAWKNYKKKTFADVFYSSPAYLKEFYTPDI